MKSPLFYFSLYMTLLGGNWIAYHVALPVRIAHHLLLTGLLVYWLLKRGLPDTPILLALLAMVAALTLSCINAIDRRMALEFSWHWLTNWLLFLFLIDWLRLRQGHAAILFKAQFAAGAIIALSCILQWLVVGGRPAGLLGVINLTGAYLAALIVPALGWFLAKRQQDGRWVTLSYKSLYFSIKTEPVLLAGFILLAAIAIILNQSRGPVLSVLVALTAFGFLTLKSNTFLKIALGAVTMGLCALIVVGLTIRPEHGTGDVVRLDLWKSGEEMLLDHPTGVGVGLFAQAYHQRTIGEDKWTGAHNYYITLGAELGAPGLAAGAAFLMICLYFLIGRPFSIQQKAVLAAMVGVLAHMIGDNYPAQNWSFLLSLYAAYLLYDLKLLNRPVPGTINRLLVYGVLVYGLLFIGWDAAQIHYENALRLKSADEAALALELDPHNQLYRLEVARLLSPGVAIGSDFAITNYGRISY